MSIPRPGEPVDVEDFVEGLADDDGKALQVFLQYNVLEQGLLPTEVAFVVRGIHGSSDGKGIEELRAIGRRWHRFCRRIRKLVVGATIEVSPGGRLSHAAPLLEKERDLGGATLGTDRLHPRGLHGAGAGTAFAADDHPVDSGQVEPPKIFNQRLDGQERHGGRGLAKEIDPGKTVRFVFDADSPPDVRRKGGGAQLRPKKLVHPFGPLGKDLVCVPVCGKHHPADHLDVVVRNLLVEEVTHRIDEDLPRAGPADRVAELFRDQAEVETEFERVTFHAAKPLGERLGVAM